MDLGLRDKAALVTGGSEGIGRAAAAALAAEGARVAIVARRREKLEEAASEIEGRTKCRPLIYQADCTLPGDVSRVVREAVRDLGGLDILVNSLGAARGGRLLELSEEEWDHGLGSKLRSQIRCCREALPHLRARGGGCIVNVIGNRGKQPDGASLTLGAANAALMNFTVALGLEEARHGVRVVGVSPAPVLTPRHRRAMEARAREWGISVEEASRRRVAEVPLGRAARPEEIGDVIAFLASGRASFITGTVVYVDGGATRTI